jgi:hypothetical protein
VAAVSSGLSLTPLRIIIIKKYVIPSVGNLTEVIFFGTMLEFPTDV